MEIRRIEVPLGDRSYPILVGNGLTAEIDSYLGPKGTRAAIITQAAIPFRLELEHPSITIEIPDGEAAKSFGVLEQVVRELVRFGLTRSDTVVAVGGGVVTDLAGFAASVYHRGVRLVNVPTTLLGMVDAAIGGKTAVNLPEGKNLVGAFHQPSAVICDLDRLQTLPFEEIQCGRGEMAKYAFLGAPELASMSTLDQVSECVSIKVNFVVDDEREGSRRALLNYGHTLAHALEAQGDLLNGVQRIKHGQAVAVGLIFAARLALALGRIDQARLEDHLHVLGLYGLDPNLPSWASPEELVTVMSRDKKATAGLTFVLDGGDGLELLSGLEPDVVLDELRRFAQTSY